MPEISKIKLGANGTTNSLRDDVLKNVLIGSSAGAETNGTQNFHVDSDNVAANTTYNESPLGKGVVFRDASNNNIGVIRLGCGTGADRRRGIAIVAANEASTVYNSLGLYVDKNGNKFVNLDASLWRDTLGLKDFVTRPLVASDITDGTFAVARIPNLAASKITSGALALVNGGTGQDNTSITKNKVFASPSNVTGAPSWRTLVEADIPQINGSHIIGSKSIKSDIIDSLDAAKLTGDIALARIPNLPTSKITNLGQRISPDVQTISVKTSWWTNIITMELTAGVWIVVSSVFFTSNPTGRRGIFFTSNSAQGTSNSNPAPPNISAGQIGSVMQLATSGAGHKINSTVILSPSSTTKYYLKAWQDSGSALSVSGTAHAVRIK